MDLSKKNVLVWDAAGLGVEHAVRIGKDFNKCWYFTPWQSGFPTFELFANGKGMENTEKVIRFFDYVDKADLIYFVDTGCGDMTKFLREKGYRVFGAGEGEKLEAERYNARKLQKKLKLPTQETVELKGITKLREYLKKTPDRYIKFDIFRGTLESFYSKDYESVELLLDEIEMGFGAFKEDYSFIAEAPIDDAIEVGTDTFFNGNKFIEPALWGVEAGIAYIGTYKDKPPVLQNTLDVFTPVLQKLNYRGAFSTEERTQDGKKSYLVDLTARYPYALSLLYTESIKNYSEVIWKVAGGEDVEINPMSKYVVCAPIESEHAQKYWLRLMFDKKLRHKIKLQMCCKVDEYYYCVKGNRNGALLISLGNNIDKCIEDIENTAKEINAHELKKDAIKPLYDIKDDIKKMNEFGFNF